MAKRAYVGVSTQRPIYNTENVSVTASNISSVFTVANNTYYFAGSGSVFTSNNAGVKSSTAKTTLTALTDMDVSFTYSYSSEKNYDKFTLTVGGTVVENAVSGSTVTKTHSATLAQGQTIIFEYTKDSSTNSNDDKCTFSAMSVVKKIQTGTETVSLAREVKKMYVGVDGVARKIKRAYIGVGGVARPFWSGGELAYYGTIAIDQPSLVYGTTLGNYAIFAGIYYTSSDSSSGRRITYAFDKNLIKTLPTALSAYRSYEIKGATAGDSYAVYANSNASSVEAYDPNLTLTTSTALAKELTSFAAGSIGSYALFAGGMDDNSDAVANVYAYNENLTRSSATSLPRAHYNMRSANVGNYVLFGTGTQQKTSVGKSWFIFAYDESLTVTTVDDDATQRSGVGSCSVNNQYALFAGGAAPGDGENLSEVAVYDSSLVKTTGTALSVERYSISSASLGNYAIFAGGVTMNTSGSSSYSYHSTVESYNLDLTRKIENNLSVARRGTMGAASIGDYALFVGGQTASNTYKSEKIADVFTIA